MIFPHQASGSLVERNGQIVGSSLIAQKFESERYFHSRPSAVDYNAASTGGSNLATSNPDYRTTVAERVAAVRKTEGLGPDAPVPSDLVQASGAGMDLHVTPAAASLQVPRVARARGVDESAVRRLVDEHTEGPWLGLFGLARVNVLELNLALDGAASSLGSSDKS